MSLKDSLDRIIRELEYISEHETPEALRLRYKYIKEENTALKRSIDALSAELKKTKLEIARVGIAYGRQTKND